jgi:hypothetical protein
VQAETQTQVPSRFWYASVYRSSWPTPSESVVHVLRPWIKATSLRMRMLGGVVHSCSFSVRFDVCYR